MRAIRTLAACVAVAAAFATPAQATGEDVLDRADAFVAQAVGVADGIRTPWEAVPPLTLKTIRASTDVITIRDTGSGPAVSIRGVFSNPNWWDCTTSTLGGPVNVQCTAKPASESGIVWECSAMVVTAHSLTNHRNVLTGGGVVVDGAVAEAQRTVQQIIGTGPGSRAAAPRVPDGSEVRWGQAAGLLSCDDTRLETETATRTAPRQQSTGTFGLTGVQRFVCEARLAKGDPSAPIPQYAVLCGDPGAPGVE